MQSAYAMGKGIAIGALVLGLSLLAASVQAAVPYDLSNFGNVSQRKCECEGEKLGCVLSHARDLRSKRAAHSGPCLASD